MEMLDNAAKPTPAPVWNTVLRNGAYYGGLLIIFSLLVYLTNFNLMTFGGLAVLYGSMLAIGFTCAAIAIRHQRDRLDGGTIGFGKALSVGLLTVFIGMVISGLWNYVLVNFIDPNYVAVMKEQFMESWGKNMPQENLDQALEGFDKSGELLNTLKSSLMGGVFFGLIIGLTTAAFLKKQPEVSMR